jgi:glycosyltransferase involved in cell wall biosynthesis
VGRLQTVKNQALLARAFVRLIQEHPQAAERMRLVIVGEGPLRAAVQDTLAQAGLQHLAWLAGARNDVADIMRSLSCFVLPSQAEGTSCTLQEAMACALPVVATAVGGTPDLVAEGSTGFLVAPDDAESMAQAIWRCYQQPEQMARFGQTARARAISHFGLSAMVQRYQRLFSQ